MSSLFFWIIILSFVVPMAMRAYRRSMARRDRNQGLPGQYPGPGQFPGPGQVPGPNQYPGSNQYPGYGQFPGSAGPQSTQPRDGYTQQDYFSGGFRRAGQQDQPPQPFGHQQPLPNQYGQQGYPQQSFPQQASGSHTPPPPAAPQGFRARKLAELDQQYTNGELSMEEYMKRRSEIMNG